MGNKHVRITVVGSYAVGLVMMTDRLPCAGETVEGRDYTEMHGGKGSNQAVACARLGAESRFVACIGADIHGDGALELYAREGVNATLVTRAEKLATGVGFIMVDDHGENSIAVDFGANRGLLPDRVRELRDEIADSSVVLTQMEIPNETAAEAMKVAHEEGVMSILNPAPFTSFPTEAWANVDVVTPNRTEAHLIIGERPDVGLLPDELAERIAGLGVGTVVMTLGADGAHIYSDGVGTTVPGVQAEVTDTTGAGDAFAAALAVALAEGNDMERSVRFAVVAGAFAVTRYGVIPALPTRAEVNALLDRQDRS